MRRLIFLILTLQTATLHAQDPLPAIGSWREHLPYNSAIAVGRIGGTVYCATPYSLFSVDISTKEVERMSRVTGLSETGISCVYADEVNGKLLVAYTNSNIDVLTNNKRINVPDIKRDGRTGDKHIYRISASGSNYYLCSGLGVIVLDGSKYEIRDSWFIGNGGNPVKVSGFCQAGGFYYAATAEGLKRAPVNASNLADYSSWQLLGGANGLSSGACEQVVSFSGKLIAQQHDSLFVLNGNTWNLFYADGWPFTDVTLSPAALMVCERQNNGAARVIQLNADGTTARILQQAGPVSYPRQAIVVNNDAWLADQFGGLSRFSGNASEQFKPNSPEATASGEMQVIDQIVYITAGEVNESWNYQYNGNGVYRLKAGVWTNFNRFKFPALDSMLDFITVAADTRDGSVWAGSYGGGLLHIKANDQFEILKQGVIGNTVGDPLSYRVSGLAFDEDHDLWVANYGSPQPIRVRKADGNWKSFTPPFFNAENAWSQIVTGDQHTVWVVGPKGNGLICYDPGASIDEVTDDHWRKFSAGAGSGNLPSSDVRCIAKDKNGYIWVGTADGIGVIQCPFDIFSAQTCEAVWPVVAQGNFAGYLFKGEMVQAIAVDGADRKWVGTRNGVWLVSTDGTKIIYRFTEDNSPLLGNDVRKITIDGHTGEVFFATSKGVCSFRSTATEGAPVQDKEVLIFPNPVPPGFSGTIGIRGLVNNAIVKITEPDGRLVYQTRALGGQAVWDGRNYRREKISSGVYLVLVSDDGRTEHTAGKIVFLQH